MEAPAGPSTAAVTAAADWEILCDPGYPALVSASPTDAAHVMVSGGGRILITRDGGVSWTSSELDPARRWASVTAVCLSPAYPDAAYAASGGLFRSSDDGRTWAAVPLSPERGLSDLGATPQITASARRPSLVLVSAGRGLLVGREDGRALTLDRPKELQDLEVRDVAVNADNTLACAATPKGVYASRDGGKTWSVSTEGFSTIGVSRLHFVPGPDGGLAAEEYRCPRGGAWTQFERERRCLAVGGPDGRTFYGISGDKLAKSTDFGRTWQPLTDPGLASSVLSVTYAHGALYVPGFYGPIMRSTDDGKTWQELPIHTPFPCAIYSTKIDPLLPDHIYVEMGLAGFLNALVSRRPPLPGERVEVRLKLVRSEDGGKTWLNVPVGDREPGWPEHFATHVTGSSAPGQVLYATPYMRFPVGDATIARSLDGGKTWEAFGDQTPLGNVRCLATEPSDTHVAYAGCSVGRPEAARIFVTRDSGRTWEQLWPDLDTSFIGNLLVRPGGEAALYAATGKGVLRLALPELPAPEAPGAGR